MPAVVQADAEKVLLDLVASVIASGALPAPPAGSTWSRGSIEPAVEIAPQWFIQVRSIGGSDVERVSAWHRVDLRVWADGTPATEETRSRAIRVLVAQIRRRMPARVMASPVPIPDPADPRRSHSLATVEVLVRGTQE